MNIIQLSYKMYIISVFEHSFLKALKAVGATVINVGAPACKYILIKTVIVAVDHRCADYLGRVRQMVGSGATQHILVDYISANEVVHICSALGVVLQTFG